MTITHRDRYGYPAQASACSRCGLVFLNPRMTAAAYGRFYDGVYRPLVSAFHGRLIDARTIQAEQREYAARPRRVRASVSRLAPACRRCSTSADRPASSPRHFAKAFGLTGTVIDPAPLEVQEARALRPRDDHRSRRGVRLRRPAVRRRADLPDGRSPARRRRNAQARARTADTERAASSSTSSTSAPRICGTGRWRMPSRSITRTT